MADKSSELVGSDGLVRRLSLSSAKIEAQLVYADSMRNIGTRQRKIDRLSFLHRNLSWFKRKSSCRYINATRACWHCRRGVHANCEQCSSDDSEGQAQTLSGFDLSV